MTHPPPQPPTEPPSEPPSEPPAEPAPDARSEPTSDAPSADEPSVAPPSSPAPPSVSVPPASVPPGSAPPAGPGRKPRTVRTLVITLVAVGVLCCGLLVGGGVLLFRWGSEATEPVQDAATAFLSDIEEGDFPNAYAQLCERTKEQFSEERFRQYASERRIRSYRLVDVSVERVNGQGSGSVRAELAYVNGRQETRTILLLKEGSTWRVCGQPY